MTAQSQELLPCPFCDAEPKICGLNESELAKVEHSPSCYLYRIHKFIEFGEQHRWQTRHPPAPQGKIEWPEALKTFDFNTQAYDRGFNYCRDLFMKIILERGIK